MTPLTLSSLNQPEESDEELRARLEKAAADIAASAYKPEEPDA